MPGIVAIPQVVEELLVQFGNYFSNEPSRRHFAEYLTGLLIAEHKTVSGIARNAAPPEQSALNRWLTQAPWDANNINRHRLERPCARLRGCSAGRVRRRRRLV